jgi:hypothetical protein
MTYIHLLPLLGLAQLAAIRFHCSSFNFALEGVYCFLEVINNLLAQKRFMNIFGGALCSAQGCEAPSEM